MSALCQEEASGTAKMYDERAVAEPSGSFDACSAGARAAAAVKATPSRFRAA